MEFSPGTRLTADRLVPRHGTFCHPELMARRGRRKGSRRRNVSPQTRSGQAPHKAAPDETFSRGFQLAQTREGPPCGGPVPLKEQRREMPEKARDRRNKELIRLSKSLPLVLRWVVETSIRIVRFTVPLSIALVTFRHHPRVQSGAILAALLLVIQVTMFAVYQAAWRYTDLDDMSAEFAAPGKKALDASRKRRATMNDSLNADLRLAGDLVGRATVLSLLWAATAALWKEVTTNSSTNFLTFEQARGEYLDQALLIGPLLGLCWWAWRMWRVEGTEYGDRHRSTTLPEADEGTAFVSRWAMPFLQVSTSIGISWLFVSIKS